MKHFACFALLGLLAACASSSNDAFTSATRGGDGAANAGAAPSSEGPATGSATSGGELAASGSGGDGGTIQAGTLTAGVWDDNRNFDWFTKFRDSVNEQGLPGFTADEQNAAHVAAQQTASAKQRLDVQLVIDTTGSMGDEIRYLDAEFDAITQTIQTKYPNAQQHWSLVAYKDVGDPYVVQPYDFRADLTELHAHLSTLEASGGGDFPESPEKALDAATKLSWRADADVARLVFWVADAPHHAKDADAMTAALRAARDKGIHVYPVAASSVDSDHFTEYTMRSAAQITGGRYVFLTDDSGVGDSHAVPSLPCFFVTKLNDAIQRIVDIELTGQYREPATAEILRTGGDPHAGACQVDGGQVQIY